MAAVPPLQVLTVPAQATHTATVIFVHGLGDSGSGMEPIANMFGSDPQMQHIKWVLPHAPLMRVTANNGMEMRSWFDLQTFDFNATEDEQGMLRTARQLNRLIADENNGGIDSRRIVLGGFSQGGAMSLLTGLTTDRRLAGLVSLSGWLALRSKFKEIASAHARSIPIFVGHGTKDPLVKFELAGRAVAYLNTQLGVPMASDQDWRGITFRAYSGVDHSTSMQELEELKAWLKRVLPV